MRSFKSALPEAFLSDYQDGVMRYAYRGVRCLKSPIDIAIYLRAIWDLKPRMILEVGTHSGGSALLLADILRVFGMDAQVYSVDLDPPGNPADDKITFVQGDVHDLGSVFDTCGLKDIPHPWMIIEDSAHTYDGCLAALDFLSQVMAPGDLLSMEDGILDELGLSERYDGGPNRAIATFMLEQPGNFTIDTALCDMFGTNATYNPNGYLRKV